MHSETELTGVVDELGVFTIIVDEEIDEPVDSKDARSRGKDQNHKLDNISHGIFIL